MRFTLASCLALTAAIAVLCYLLTAKPSGISYLLLVSIIVFAPICAVAGIVYGRDNLRAFSIGAAFPLALLVWSSAGHLQEISFDPAAYGWQSQGQTGGQAAPATVTYTIPGIPSMPPGGYGGGPTPGGGSIFVTQPWIAVGYDTTVNKATLMKNPTCALSIAAILGGVLVMAIRGGLKQKEPPATTNSQV
jgi:hypothetical protein